MSVTSVTTVTYVVDHGVPIDGGISRHRLGHSDGAAQRSVDCATGVTFKVAKSGS